MVLFVIFCVQKKKKKVPKWLEWMYFLLILLYVEMKRYRSASGRGRVCRIWWEPCCGWRPSVSLFGFVWVFFSSVVIFTFVLSLLHHNETFSTNIHTDPVVVQWREAISLYSGALNGTGFRHAGRHGTVDYFFYFSRPHPPAAFQF